MELLLGVLWWVSGRIKGFIRGPVGRCYCRWSVYDVRAAPNAASFIFDT